MTTLVEVDGWLMVRYEYADYAKPEMHVFYWPTKLWAADFKQRYTYELPCKLSDVGSGRYQLPSSFGFHGPIIELAEGGKTQASKVEHLPIMCPKVRKGIETRYYNSGWQKYLKSEAWVNF